MCKICLEIWKQFTVIVKLKLRVWTLYCVLENPYIFWFSKGNCEILHYPSLTHEYVRPANDGPLCNANGERSKSVYTRRRPVGHRHFCRRITITVDRLVFADRTAAIPFVCRRSSVFLFRSTKLISRPETVGQLVDE